MGIQRFSVENSKAESSVDVSVIVVSFNTRELTLKCLESIEKYSAEIKYEILVVDNNSTDGSADAVAERFPHVNLMRNKKNVGFAAGNNHALEIACGRYVLLMNSDAFLTSNVLLKTVQYMDQNSDVGVLGCKLVSESGDLQPSARMLPGLINKFLHVTGLAARYPHSKIFGRADFTWWDHSHPKNVGWVVGAYFMIRRETINQIGMLDDLYFLYFEEIDFCLRAIKNGWKVAFFPHAKVVHLGGQSSLKTSKRVSSSGRQLIPIRLSSEFRYYRKWYGLFHVIASGGIELVWNFILYLRNLCRNTEKGINKRNQALRMMRLIIRILIQDRFGGETKPFKGLAHNFY